jgi:hypothetical protein
MSSEFESSPFTPGQSGAGKALGIEVAIPPRRPGLSALPWVRNEGAVGEPGGAAGEPLGDAGQ